MLSRSVMSSSLQAHGLQSTRLLCPWGFSSQEYWRAWPCSPPGHLPTLGIEPASLVPPALAEGFFTSVNFYSTAKRFSYT